MAKSGAAGARRSSPNARAEDRAYVERQDRLVTFLADPPPEILAAAIAVGRAREHYGDDIDRELADIAEGRHPLQRQRAKTPPR